MPFLKQLDLTTLTEVVQVLMEISAFQHQKEDVPTNYTAADQQEHSVLLLTLMLHMIQSAVTEWEKTVSVSGMAVFLTDKLALPCNLLHLPVQSSLPHT